MLHLTRSGVWYRPDMTKMTPIIAVKIAVFGRWTPQKRGAFYLSRQTSETPLNESCSHR